MRIIPSVVALSSVWLLACGHSATTPAPGTGVGAGDWPSYNRTLAGDRFSPLTEITPSNVAQLTPVCTYNLPEVAALQSGPIVVGGAMFFSTDTITYAIDAGTCAERWHKARHVTTPGGGPAVNRGAGVVAE